MAQKDSVTKEIRFEVFKRDSFTCQECGAKSPDAILEVSTVNPFYEDGYYDIENLLTSCFSCIRLYRSENKKSNYSLVDKQRQQIEELNLRRQQLEMMLDWKNGIISSSKNELEDC